jgi:hypothetical protein
MTPSWILYTAVWTSSNRTPPDKCRLRSDEVRRDLCQFNVFQHLYHFHNLLSKTNLEIQLRAHQLCHTQKALNLLVTTRGSLTALRNQTVESQGGILFLRIFVPQYYYCFDLSISYLFPFRLNLWYVNINLALHTSWRCMEEWRHGSAHS